MPVRVRKITKNIINMPISGDVICSRTVHVSGTAYRIKMESEDGHQTLPNQYKSVYSVIIELKKGNTVVKSVEQVDNTVTDWTFNEYEWKWSTGFDLSSFSDRQALWISARARLAQGGAGEEKRTVTFTYTVDREVDLLEVDNPPPGTIFVDSGPEDSAFSVLFKGKAYDRNGLVSVNYTINDINGYLRPPNVTENLKWDTTLNVIWDRSREADDAKSQEHSITVKAEDICGNTLQLVRSFKIQDLSPPYIEVTSHATDVPTKLTWRETGLPPVTLRGWARDRTSGVSKLRWRRFGGAWSENLLTNVSSEAEWNFEAPLHRPGLHIIEIEATDGAGNSTAPSVSVEFDVALPLELRDLSPQAYLQDLLDFAGYRVVTGGSAELRVRDITDGFLQPFDRFSDPLHRETALQPVAQARVVNECLFGLFAQSVDTEDIASGSPSHTLLPLTLPPLIRMEYVERAYRALLVNLGTSYEEIGLVHRADAAIRDALATRLGIGVANLDALFLQRVDEGADDLPEQQILSEARLQSLFGLQDTGADPLRPPTVEAGEFYLFQRHQLVASWHAAFEQQVESETAIPSIDPDLVMESELRNAIDGDPAYQLWKTRSEWISERLQWFRSEREAHESVDNATTGFDFIMNTVLGGIDLNALAASHEGGENIEAALAGYALERFAFFHLVEIRKLVDARLASESEWADVYSILVQVEKHRQLHAWSVAESDDGVVLSSKWFTVSETAPSLPRWRASSQRRREWVATLEARAERLQVLADALRTAVAETEEVVLPVLRDALIAQIDYQAGYPDVDLQDWLTQRFGIGFKYSGDQRLTRVEQAIETVQNLLFSLRTGRFQSMTDLHIGRPVTHWQLAVTPGRYGETDFDAEWAWMGSYASWRAALSALAYPENYLQPTLRPIRDRASNAPWTDAFVDFMKGLRGSWNLTAHEARRLASTYLTKLNDDRRQQHLTPIDFELTPDLTRAQLEQRRSASRDILVKYIDPVRKGLLPEGFESEADPPNLYTPPHLIEVYFHVPVALALALQRAGEYKAALDWFQTVYAFDLRPDERKIFYGLQAEMDIETEFRRSHEWLIGIEGIPGLDPYEIARDRAGTYTSFIILSIVRCMLAYADSEFTRETNESIPNARRLYINALDLLNEVLVPRLRTMPEPLAHWRLDRNERYIARDASGNGHTAKLHGTKWLPQGWREGALAFNGETAYAEIAHADALALGKNDTDFSVTFGINLQGESRGVWRSLLHKGSTNTERTLGIWLQPHTNHLHYRISTTHNWNAGGDSHAELALNRWTHVACIKQANRLKLYLDGQLDSEAQLTGQSVSNAGALYVGKDPWCTGCNVLLDDIRIYGQSLTEDQIYQLASIAPFPRNPVIETLRRHVEVNLEKLRAGRNVAGMERAREPLVAEQPQLLGGRLVPAASASRLPTPYRYSALIARAKELVTIAQQIEAAFLSAVEKQDAGSYDLLRARQDIELNRAAADLQDLRVVEARVGIDLSKKQQERAEVQFETYDRWIKGGKNHFETTMLKNYEEIKTKRNWVARMDATISIAQQVIAVSGTTLPWDKYSGGIAAVTAAAATAAKEIFVEQLNDAEYRAQFNSFEASFRRRKDEWELQKSLANKDIEIGSQRIAIARLQGNIAEQERAIADLQLGQSEAAVEFLHNKFTNVELYEWMSEVLGEVYRSFLQQATAMAQLAYHQLAFERQELPPSFIQGDYWETPAQEQGSAGGNDEAVDRRGLTGSVRLLRDVHQLDLYAFNTNKRKLQLTQTFSLARLFPFEFQRFRETGVLPFVTPMTLFDRGFPGHYLRLVKRVRVSVVALVPPNQGIRATLSAAGLSRVVTGSGNFRTINVRRPAEQIAFTSPTGATGLLELQQKEDLLLPFEGAGVDTAWELEMPKAANGFDYESIADVLLTIDYSAQHSEDYRQQVIRELDNRFNAERPFSLRQEFPDQWYHLVNAQSDGTDLPLAIEFETRRSDFPPNMGWLRLDNLVLYVVRADGTNFEVDMVGLCFRFQDNEGHAKVVECSGTQTMNGVISTRRTNGQDWALCLMKLGTPPPIGSWRFEFKGDAITRTRFGAGEIEDVLIVISYQGTMPLWPR